MMFTPYFIELLRIIAMAATNQFLPDLPIGISNWQVIRDDKMFFVDKTAQLGDLVTNQRKIFIFSRTFLIA